MLPSVFRRRLHRSLPLMMLALCLLYGRAPPLPWVAGFRCAETNLSRTFDGRDTFPTRWLLVGALLPPILLVST